MYKTPTNSRQKIYSEVTKQNSENKHSHSCHTILEKLTSHSADSLPKFIFDHKSSLSPSESSQAPQNFSSPTSTPSTS